MRYCIKEQGEVHIHEGEPEEIYELLSLIAGGIVADETEALRVNAKIMKSKMSPDPIKDKESIKSMCKNRSLIKDGCDGCEIKEFCKDVFKQAPVYW